MFDLYFFSDNEGELIENFYYLLDYEDNLLGYFYGTLPEAVYLSNLMSTVLSKDVYVYFYGMHYIYKASYK